MTMKTAALSLLTAGTLFLVSPAFANDKTGDHACCTKTASNSEAMCVDYASLNLTADQKSKIETWQAECTKAGCTKESRHAFLKQAKGILSPDQFAKLKQQCKASKTAKQA